AGGRRAGRPRRGEQARAGAGQLTAWGEPPVYDSDALYDTIEVLAGIGQERGVSAAQVALAYTLGRPAVTSVVIGARTADQLADNLAAAELTLTAQEREQLDQASPLPLISPYRHQPQTP